MQISWRQLKKSAYITLFVVLGVLVNFLIHAVVELAVIELLTRDFARFGLGLSWQSWFTIHTVFAVVLLAGCALAGLQQGYYWWNRRYGSEV